MDTSPTTQEVNLLWPPPCCCGCCGCKGRLSYLINHGPLKARHCRHPLSTLMHRRLWLPLRSAKTGGLSQGRCGLYVCVRSVAEASSSPPKENACGGRGFRPPSLWQCPSRRPSPISWACTPSRACWRGGREAVWLRHALPRARPIITHIEASLVIMQCAAHAHPSTHACTHTEHHGQENTRQLLVGARRRRRLLRPGHAASERRGAASRGVPGGWRS